MCQLNLTLDVPLAEAVEAIAKGKHVATGRAARILLEQRLKLEKAGWGPNDRDLYEILMQVCSLQEKQRGKLLYFLQKNDLMPKPASGSVEGLVENSFFESSKFNF
jgi:hypothetical protein